MNEIKPINKSELKASIKHIYVQANDGIYRKLGNNNYNFLQMLCELIDNALAARLNPCLNVRINLFFAVDETGKQQLVRLEIVDDASGIPFDQIADAVSPGANDTVDGVNEHGMGMKQAVAGLGELEYLITKTIEDQVATLIDTFKFGELEAYEVEDWREHGTTIAVKNIAPNTFSCRQEYITKYLAPMLGAIYRYFLKEDNKKMNLTIALIEEGQTTPVRVWDVVEFKPIYFHPKTAKNEPVIRRHLLQGDGWKAELTFGYAPTEEQLTQDLGMDPLPNYHPYRVTNNHQGLDVLIRDRVIMLHQLKELELVGSSHPQYNHIRGELNLLTGFSTTVTKTGVKRTRAFQECLEQVYDILHGFVGINGSEPKDYLKTEAAPEGLPEALLTHRLVEQLKENPFATYKDIYTELPIEGVGRVDVLATNQAEEVEIFEVKAGASKAQDVFQLFMYMIFKQVKRGCLVAAKHSTGSQYAKDVIVKQFESIFPGLKIELRTHKSYGIEGAADSAERQVFFKEQESKKTKRKKPIFNLFT